MWNLGLVQWYTATEIVTSSWGYSGESFRFLDASSLVPPQGQPFRVSCSFSRWSSYATDLAFVNYSVISCEVSYEQVQSTTTFVDFPSYRISSDSPPIVDESETKPLDSSDAGSLVAAIGVSSAFYNTSLTTLNGYPMIDSVTSALIYGNDGVPAEKLFQYPPAQYLIPRLKHLIRVMGAQYMSYFYRSVDTSMPLVGSNIPATLEMGPIYRLKQSATSTRILEGLLAASWVFAVITGLTFRSRDVVKAKLGSLAATIALVADSELVRDLRKEQDKITNGKDGSEERVAMIVQAERTLASEGYQFSLGWWEVKGLSTSSEGQSGIARRRWGIDIGRAD